MIWSDRRYRMLFAALLATAALVTFPVGAEAASQPELRVRSTELEADGGVKLVVSVAGAAEPLTAASFTVTESGVPVQSVQMARLEEASLPVGVVLVFDTSGSTAGRALADAKSAARTFLASLPAATRVALVSFADRARIAVPFTSDRTRLRTAIRRFRAGGGTALYDAVRVAASLAAKDRAQGNLVVFSDGDDSSSRASLSQAVTAARAAKAPVTAIGLRTAQLDPATLRALASRTGGRTIDVSRSADLHGAFEEAARDISSQYVLTYDSPPARGPSDLEIAVTASVGGAEVSDAVVALNPRTVVPDPPRDAPAPAGPLVPAFTSPVGLWIGAGAAFAALILLVGVVLWRPKKSRESAVLARGLRLYVRGANREKSRQRRREGGSGLARRAAEVVDKLPKPKNYEENLQTLLERAGWPFRAAEFIAIQAGAALVGGLLGVGLLGRWTLGMVLAVGLPVGLKLFLKKRVASRQAAVLGQLPDTLQLLAGSLQAGYGFMQAIDTLVKESPAPTSTEFGRVLNEARLGMPVEDALNGMADRIGSEDFKWVVLAINIQRQVGGNLAVLLRTVSDTLRERERVRRQIKVLSAEGKLSAWILGALPFGIAGYIMTVNPGFLQTMTEDRLGKMMIAFALGMLGIGIAWMRKIIRIEV